jgi:hypothetical protein
MIPVRQACLGVFLHKPKTRASAANTAAKATNI